MRAEIVIVVPELVPRKAWQAAIDRDELGLRLGPGRGDGGARLGDRPAAFRFQEVAIDTVPDLERQPGPWRHGLAFAGAGEPISSLAARSAALGYLLAGGGALVDPISGPLDVLSWVRTRSTELGRVLPPNMPRSSSMVRAVRH